MTRGELNPGEPHPSCKTAQAILADLTANEMATWMEAFSSCAIEGNRLAEVCAETMGRITRGEPVSDRYLMGLALQIKYGAMIEADRVSFGLVAKARRIKGKK